MKPIYRADHVGSLLRQNYLLEARSKRDAGELSEDALHDIEDRAIREVLAMQRGVGMPILSDGELRRESWYSEPSAAIDGFVETETVSVWTDTHGRPSEQRYKSAFVTSKLKPRRRFTGRESAFLAREAGGPFKVTMPSVALLANMCFKPGLAAGVYDTPKDLLVDLTAIQKTEFAGLVADGASYIQIDEGFTPFVGDAWRAPMKEAGLDPDRAVADAIAAENLLYDSIDRENVTLAIHICRGNSRSTHMLSGGYDGLAEQVFGGLHVDRFLLEYDSARAGGFEPLRFMPKGKIAVLGLITTKVGDLESEDVLLRQIEDAARHIPIEQLAISPQCGFASSKLGNDIAVDEQRRKLELTVKVAEKVWGHV